MMSSSNVAAAPKSATPTTELRRSFSWRTVAAAGGLVSTLLLSITVVRSLDSRESATFFAILAALSIGPLVGRLGLGPNVIRLIPAEPDTRVRRGIAGTHLKATFLLTCASAPLVAVVSCNGLLGHPNFLPVVALTTGLIIVESTRLMLSDIFAAVGDVPASVATMHYVRSLLTLPLVTLVLFALSRPSLVSVLATYLVAAAIQFVLASLRARRYVAFFDLSTGPHTLRNTIGRGVQLLTLEFSELMMLQGTIWLATATLAPAAATQYGAAVTLAMQVTVLESLSTLAVAPPAARLWADGQRKQVVRMLSNAATLSTLVVVAIVGLLAVLGWSAVEFAYGRDIRPAGTLLLVLAVSGIFQAAFTVNITVLIISGHIAASARTAVWVFSVAFPIAVAAAWLGGPIALAVVTSVSVSAMAVCQWLTARKVLGEAPRPHLNVVRATRELMSDDDA